MREDSISKKVITPLIYLLVLGLNFLIAKNAISATIPKPDHVVICVLENHTYNQVVDTIAAPYIFSLIPLSANLREYYAITHPSQPNYLIFFSGSSQGVIDDNLPLNTPWMSPNLGGSLINAGYSFAGYSEDLPVAGSLVASSGDYFRKHCPWVNWQGTGLNQIPWTCNLSMNDFPTNFNDLPDLSFVIPNQNNDMHNGVDPLRITTADNWIFNHLKPYIDWAQTNNSLFVLMFDEDNSLGINQTLCLFNGPMIMPGDYLLNGYNHFDMLRTFEDMYGLPYAGFSANANPIEEIWRVNSVDVVETNSQANGSTTIFPNPLNENSVLSLNENIWNEKSDLKICFFDISGRLAHEESIPFIPGQKSYNFDKNGLSKGIFAFRISSNDTPIGSGKIIVE